MSDLTAAIARVRAATTFADGEPMPDGALPHDDFYCGELRTLIAAAERAAAQPVAWQLLRDDGSPADWIRITPPLPDQPEKWRALYANTPACEPTRHPCGHLMVSDACVVCDSPAACKAHESCCRHDEPQIAPAEQPVRDAYTLPAPDVAAQAEPPADALVEEESISDMLSRHDRETRAAILRAHHKMIGAEAKRDAVERQMQTFNAVVQERDAKIVEATERAERAESALAAANERAEGMRVALEAADGMRRGEDCPMCDAGTLRNPAKLHWDSCAFANYDIARAALARKEGE